MVLRDNEPMSALTHLVGALLGAAGLVVLILAAMRSGTAWHIVGFAVFGVALVLLYSASATYHFISASSRHKPRFRKIDHSMIFVLIAGTYTPICLTALRGPWGWSLLGVAWAIAAVGVAFKAADVRLPETVQLLMYIGMGWLPAVAFVPLKASLGAGIVWLFGGGILYTVGAVFYAIDHRVPRTRWLGMHEVFHLFVMAASGSHFWLMLAYVLPA